MMTFEVMNSWEKLMNYGYPGRNRIYAFEVKYHNFRDKGFFHGKIWSKNEIIN